ncbi:MAG: YabP/YqfC family sporulation protein [Clostridia bacterium]|nr:YabP/YqfC family sporulation protein [Clostridia bacterium]
MKKKEKKDGYRLSELGVYIYGQRRLIADGYASIRDYTDGKVVFGLNKKDLFLVVSGRGLSLRCAGREVTEVSGHIDGVSYVRGGDL